MQGYISSGGCRGESIFLTFPEAACIPWLEALFSSIEASSVTSSNLSPFLSVSLAFASILSSPSLTLLLTSFIYNNTYQYTGPIWMIEDTLPIPRSLTSYVQGPFCHVIWHIHKYGRLKHEYLWGPYFAYHRCTLCILSSVVGPRYYQSQSISGSQYSKWNKPAYSRKLKLIK